MYNLSPFSFVKITVPASPFLKAFTLSVKSLPFKPSLPVIPLDPSEFASVPFLPSLPSVGLLIILSTFFLKSLPSLTFISWPDISTSKPSSPVTFNFWSFKFTDPWFVVPSFVKLRVIALLTFDKSSLVATSFPLIVALSDIVTSLNVGLSFNPIVKVPSPALFVYLVIKFSPLKFILLLVISPFFIVNVLPRYCLELPSTPANVIPLFKVFIILFIPPTIVSDLVVFPSLEVISFILGFTILPLLSINSIFDNTSYSCDPFIASFEVFDNNPLVTPVSFLSFKLISSSPSVNFALLSPDVIDVIPVKVEFKLNLTPPLSDISAIVFVPFKKLNPVVNVVVLSPVPFALYPILWDPILLVVTTLLPPIVTSPSLFIVNVDVLSPSFNSIDLIFFKSLESLNVNVSVEVPFSTLILSLAVSPATFPSPTKFNVLPSAVVISVLSFPLNLIPPLVKFVMLFVILFTLVVKVATLSLVVFNCFPVTASVEEAESSASASPVIFLEFTVISLSPNVNFALFSPDVIDVIPVKFVLRLNLTTPSFSTVAVVFVPFVNLRPLFNVTSLAVSVFAAYFNLVSDTSVFVT